MDQVVIQKSRKQAVFDVENREHLLWLIQSYHKWIDDKLHQPTYFMYKWILPLNK